MGSPNIDCYFNLIDIYFSILYKSVKFNIFREVNQYSRFLYMTLNESDWDFLLDSIGKKKCIPFFGAGASVQFVPPGHQIASHWAQAYKYPFETSYDLKSVSQFLAITEFEMMPKELLRHEFSKLSIPEFATEELMNTPQAVVADLDLPIYITTNYDLLVEAALRSRGKEPVSEFCRWNGFLRKYSESMGNYSVFDNHDYVPTVDKPLVFHLHGIIDVPQSLVLTETDYINFLGSMVGDESSLLPPVIIKAIYNGSFLFIGYSLRDVNFHVILKGILPASYSLRSFLVQIPIGIVDNPFTSDKVNTRAIKAQEYFEKYQAHIIGIPLGIYWGTIEEFTLDLRSRLKKFKEESEANLN